MGWKFTERAADLGSLKRMVQTKQIPIKVGYVVRPNRAQYVWSSFTSKLAFSEQKSLILRLQKRQQQ